MQQWGKFHTLGNLFTGFRILLSMLISVQRLGIPTGIQSWQALARQVVRHMTVGMLCISCDSAGIQVKLYQTCCTWETGSMLRTFLL